MSEIPPQTFDVLTVAPPALYGELSDDDLESVVGGLSRAVPTPEALPAAA
jgi:hypothetical protein